MAKRPRDRSERPSHPPLWLVEGLDIVHRKRALLAAVIGAVVAVGVVLALLFPGAMPRTPEVGAAIGLAALLLGLAAAVATDATDLVVRGPRHVAAAGGELVAVLPREPSVPAAGPLAAAVLEVREPGVPLLLALATASRDARRSNAWTDAIGRALVAEGVGVLRVDLASGRSEQAGLVEVVRDGLRLADAVVFEPGLKLAHLSAGRDHAEALQALTELPGRLPRDLDIMLVSLPTAASRSVVSAATALDHVLVVVERDRTSRVDLIASLDALEAAGTHAQAVLLDTQTALRLAPPVAATPETEAARRRTISSTVGTAPVVAPDATGASDEMTAEGDGPPGEEGPATTVLEEDEVTAALPDDEDEIAATQLDADLAVDEIGSSSAEPDDGDRPHDTAPGEEQAGGDAVDAPQSRTGPLAAGVAGAGLAAGLGAVTARADEDDDLADLEPEPEGEPEVEAAGSGEAGGDAEASVEQAVAPAAEEELEDAEPATDRDLDDPAGEQRDLELLEAAAAATAMSVAGAEDESVEADHLDELPAAHDLEDELPQPDTAPLVEEVVELPSSEAPEVEPEAADDVAGLTSADDVADDAVVPTSADEAAAAPPADQPPGGDDLDDLDDDDPTDRLPPVGVGEPAEPDLFAAGDEDLLRTTAQLAMLADDLELRGQGRDRDQGDVDGGAAGATDDDEHDAGA